MKECYLSKTVYFMIFVITIIFEPIIEFIKVVIINVSFKC